MSPPLTKTLWCPEAPAARLEALQDAQRLGRTLASLAARGVPPDSASTVAEAATRLLLGGGRAWNMDQLLQLVASHGAETVAENWRFGPPPRLWDRLLRAAGVRPSLGEALWTDGRREGLPAGWQGAAQTEWWASPDHPGASFDGRLWAWGRVEERALSGATLGTLSPRAIWRREGEDWRTHPVALTGTAELGPARPRLEEGPGFLLACVVDSVGDLTREIGVTDRDRATLWGALLLPLLAPARSARILDGRPAWAAPPDYQQLAAFALLHPRTQEAIAGLDQLATILAVEDWNKAAAVASAAGVSVRGSGPRGGLLRLAEGVAEAMLRRDAASTWDSGFGFRLVRSALREVFEGGPGEFVRRWDLSTAGPPGTDGVGPLAERLREALSTALGFPGRPAFPKGPAAAQLVELIWARWTDPTYLA